jgi:ABC-type arginine/histidine transport system permease subunit
MDPVLGAFAKLRKATISFVLYVCLSVCLSVLRMEQRRSHWTDFHQTLYLNIFRNSVVKIKVFF